MQWNTDMKATPLDGTPILAVADGHGWRGQFARVCIAFDHGQWRVYGPTLGEPNGDGKTRQWLGEVCPVKWMHLPPDTQ